MLRYRTPAVSRAASAQRTERSGKSMYKIAKFTLLASVTDVSAYKKVFCSFHRKISFDSIDQLPPLIETPDRNQIVHGLSMTSGK